jgi:hypothetical protein
MLSMLVKSTILNSNCIEVRIQHPLAEIGIISIFVFKLEKEDFLFSIPHHHWSLLYSDLRNSQFHWPSSFQYSPYKEQLKSIMEFTMASINENLRYSSKKAQ